MRFGNKRDQVAVSLVIGSKHGEVIALVVNARVFIMHAVCCNIHFAADNRFYSGLLRLLIKFYCSVQIAMIGERQRIHFKFCRALQYKKPDVAERLIYDYQDIFGKGNFYLEVQPHAADFQKAINEGLFQLGPKTGLKIVATNDIHYIRPEDADAQDILVSVQTGNRVQDEDRLSMKDANISMRTAAEIADFFPHNPEVITNTQEIAERVNLEIELGKNHLPLFAVPAGFDAN